MGDEGNGISSCDRSEWHPNQKRQPKLYIEVEPSLRSHVLHHCYTVPWTDGIKNNQGWLVSFPLNLVNLVPFWVIVVSRVSLFSSPAFFPVRSHVVSTLFDPFNIRWPHFDLEKNTLIPVLSLHMPPYFPGCHFQAATTCYEAVLREVESGERESQSVSSLCGQLKNSGYTQVPHSPQISRCFRICVSFFRGSFARIGCWSYFLMLPFSNRRVCHRSGPPWPSFCVSDFNPPK